MNSPPAVPLSAGLPRANRVFVVFMAVLSLIIVAPLALLLSYAPMGNGTGSVLGFVLRGLAVVLVLTVGYALVRVFRSGAWLRGTELVVRGAFRSKAVDLASAQTLRLTKSNSGWSGRSLIPTLDAFDDARGRSVTVHFGRHNHGFLPLFEVEALVAAIRAGWRTGVPAQQAEHTTRELYLLAYTPNQGPG